MQRIFGGFEIHNLGIVLSKTSLASNFFGGVVCKNDYWY